MKDLEESTYSLVISNKDPEKIEVYYQSAITLFLDKSIRVSYNYKYFSKSKNQHNDYYLKQIKEKYEFFNTIVEHTKKCSRHSPPKLIRLLLYTKIHSISLNSKILCKNDALKFKNIKLSNIIIKN